MPLHDFRCRAGHVTEEYVQQGVTWIECPVCIKCTPECAAQHIPGYEVLHVGYRAEMVFLKAPASFVQRDVCYDSPIDGRAITTAQARQNDLARSECIPYEPGMKQDAARHKLERDQQLDKSVDSSVDQFFATAGSRKLEKLEQELRAGATVEVKRDSPATTT